MPMSTLHQRYKRFWTPEYWQRWREDQSPYRRYKSDRDRHLALQLLALQDGARVLEVGCGYGWIAQALVTSARIQWIGIDLSSQMTSHCVQTIPKGLATVADALSLPFHADAFDTVLCSGVLMHVEDEPTALMEMTRVLRPEGRLVISANNLLSPFAIPSVLWNARKRHYKQSFRPPWVYERWLKRVGLRLERMVGDTLLAVGMQLPGRIGSIPPQRWFKLMMLPDRLLETRLRYFAYEIWFAAVKPGRVHGE
jgi:ubiquinone/menaquinone biosynthesis C-methylase UbiE